MSVFVWLVNRQNLNRKKNRALWEGKRHFLYRRTW